MEETSIFANLNPWSYHTFNTPNPVTTKWLDAEQLKISFFDNGSKPSDDSVPVVVGVVVPKGREADPLFTTKEGLLHLMCKFYGLSRLFVVANKVNSGPNATFSSYTIDDDEKAIIALENFLGLYVPHVAVSVGVKVIHYKDGLIYSRLLHHGDGFNGGEFVITNEEVKMHNKKQFWRRVRFTRSPGFVHSQARLFFRDYDYQVAEVDLDKAMLPRDDLIFEVDHDGIVDPVTQAMLVGLNSALCLKRGHKVLCFGATTGILARFLSNDLDCQVVIADGDEEIVSSVRDAFEIPESVFMESSVHPMDIIDEAYSQGTKKNKSVQKLFNKDIFSTPFDILVIDMKSFEYGTRTGLCKPPRQMIIEAVLNKMKVLVKGDGAIIMHVIAPDYVFYSVLLGNLIKVFDRVFKVDISNDEFVFVAMLGSPADFSVEDVDLEKKLESLMLPFTSERVTRP